VIGFIAGFYIGAHAIQIAMEQGFLETTLGIIFGLLGGVIGAFASYVFVMIGIIIVAGLLGFAVAGGILSLFDLDPSCISALIGLGSAGAAVWLTLRYKLVRYVLIIMTAVLGSTAIMLSVLLFLNRITVAELTSQQGIVYPVFNEAPVFWIISLVLIGAGIYVQYLASREFDFENINVFERWSAANR
jgi:hypothetical protein